MKRSPLFAAMALSIGLSGWLQLGPVPTTLAGDCAGGCSCHCHGANAPHGLLDRLDNYACSVIDNRSPGRSLLSAFRLSPSGRTSHCRCGHASGTRETACQAEPTCGSEVPCGTRADCGVEASCGCACATRGKAPVPPIPTLQNYQEEMEHIPAPRTQDATVDPFRDDDAVYTPPTRLPARSVSTQLPKPPQRRSSGTGSASATSHSRQKSELHYDPTARALPATLRRGSQMDTALAATSSAASSSRRLHSDREATHERPVAPESLVRVPLMKVPDERNLVVPAAATQPATSGRVTVTRPQPVESASKRESGRTPVEEVPNPLRGE